MLSVGQPENTDPIVQFKAVQYIDQIKSFYLLITLETTNTSETFTVYKLVKFKAIEIFVNQSFIDKH